LSSVAAAAGTTSTGAFAVALTGSDNAGRSATVSCPYVVKRALLGVQLLEPALDQNVAGLAEAFRSAAVAAGTISRLQLYVDPTSQATSLIVGIYSDVNGHPGALLSRATIATPANGTWNYVSIPPVVLAAGSQYWIALLSPAGGGTVRFRDRCCGVGGTNKSETSRGTALADLPATWVTGSRFDDGPLSGGAG
jgi:hypothetical protein